MANGRMSGLVSGLGAASADALYGCIAGFGLTFISHILISQQLWFRLGGGVFLCYLGIKTLLAKPVGQSPPAKRTDYAGAYASTFFLTLTNPMTILSFGAIFAGLGLVSASGDYTSAGVMVLGVFIGSGLWWIILSGGVGMFRKSLNIKRLRWINRISGAIIIGFGLLSFLSLKASEPNRLS